MIQLVSVEGCHGIGKTSVVEHIRDMGCDTIDEGFFDFEPINPKRMTSPLNEIEIMRSWFKRVIRKIRECEELGIVDDNADHVIYIDRSPFACCAYMGAHEDPDVYPMLHSSINLYISMARQFLYEMLTDYDVEFIMVMLEPRLGMEQLQSQIESRLQDEEEFEKRKDLKETNTDLINHVNGVLKHCQHLVNSWTTLPHFANQVHTATVLVDHMEIFPEGRHANILNKTRVEALKGVIREVAEIVIARRQKANETRPKPEIFDSREQIDPLLHTLGIYHKDTAKQEDDYD